MGCTDVIALPASRQAKALVLLLLLADTLCLLPLYYMQQDWPAAVIAAYALPAVLVVALILAIAIAKAGEATLPPGILLLGLLLIVGGAAFDMTATVIHSPYLSQEQNAIARSLLDGGHDVSFVYGYAVICQSLYVAFIATLWIGLLRHRTTILNSTRGSRTFPELVKAATGGSELSWRQWCLPQRLSELPRAYHLLWMIAVILVAGSVYRWYLGFEWYGVFPGFALWIQVAAVAVGLSLYFRWLWRATELGREAA